VALELVEVRRDGGFEELVDQLEAVDAEDLAGDLRKDEVFPAVRDEEAAVERPGGERDVVLGRPAGGAGCSRQGGSRSRRGSDELAARHIHRFPLETARVRRARALRGAARCGPWSKNADLAEPVSSTCSRWRM